MTKLADEQLYELLSDWGLDKNRLVIKRYGSGHINETYCVADKEDADNGLYILQSINHDVFSEPENLIKNIIGVTSYLAKIIEAEGKNPQRETMNLIPTLQGDYYRKIRVKSLGSTKGEEEYWRLYHYVRDTMVFQQSPSAKIFAESGRVFGCFARRLINYPADTLYETISHFHDTPKRFVDFKEALKADTYSRAKDCSAEINFILERKKECSILQDLLRQKKLPLRVTHNDTKLNNVLFDRKTGKGLCVVDLDTVMPGLLAHDYGDSIRFGASTALEDEPDLNKVHFSLELFEVYTKAYLEEVGTVMTKQELFTLAWGARLMTLECGIRFLTDYLMGDVYFKTNRKHHNLERAKTQIKLVAEMEENFEIMQKIILRSVQFKA